MVYQYIGYNENGEVVKGRLSASSEEAAIDLLSYVGYQTVNLKPFAPFFSLDRLLEKLFPVKPAEIALFYRELAMLLETGTDIVASLELLQGQASNRTLKRVLGEIIFGLRSGTQLSEALGKHPKVFSPIYSRLLGVGEQSGSLETVLMQIADYIEKEVNITKDIKNALIYPVITSLGAMIVVGVLVIFVLPSFGIIYGSLGIELPPLTKIVIAISTKIQNYGVYLLLAVFIAAGLSSIYVKTKGGRYKWDKLVFSLPLVGRVSHLSELARHCRNMSLLFRAGLPLTELMSLVIQGSSNRVMAEALVDVQQGMVKGEGLSRPMARNNLFLPLMVQMVRIGEETGNLDTTLLAVARSYEAQATTRTQSLIALIQPTMILIIGLVVGFIALSMTSAMYSMYGQGF